MISEEINGNKLTRARAVLHQTAGTAYLSLYTFHCHFAQRATVFVLWRYGGIGYCVLLSRLAALYMLRRVLPAATRWVFDFSSQLLFPTIDHVLFSVSTAAGFVQAVARPAQGRTVVIETSAPVDATVSVEVSQAL